MKMVFKPQKQKCTIKDVIDDQFMNERVKEYLNNAQGAINGPIDEDQGEEKKNDDEGAGRNQLKPKKKEFIRILTKIDYEQEFDQN